MSTASHFYQKVLRQPELCQVVFRVAVLDKYLNVPDVTVKRTETVGRVRAATWAVDFGIAPAEDTLHVTLGQLIQKLPESEQGHWLEHLAAQGFSQNFLKMQGSHACIDDGGLRNWGEEEGLI